MSNTIQRLFTCEATGHQGYTYFEAHNSEVCSTHDVHVSGQNVTAVQLEASKEINSVFPEGLRARVLALVQFKETARMDDLGKSSPLS